MTVTSLFLYLVINAFVNYTHALKLLRKTSAIVIGGSGTIGLEVVQLLNLRHCNGISSSFMDNERLQRQKLLSMKSCTAFVLNFEKDHAIVFPPFQATTDKILINCAGLCLSGASFESFRRSISINTHGPVNLTKKFIAESICSQGTGTTSIVNVSSGDGELGNLHSTIQNRLIGASSTAELDAYVDELAHTFDPDFEYAFGSTPMYSLSKALLNRYTQLLHREHSSDWNDIASTKAGASAGRKGAPRHGIRVLACCPGNVASPMSTAEELLSAIPARLAAEQIVELATEYEKYPGGVFYRDCVPIPW